MFKRSQYKGYRSGWSELLFHDCPRFGESRSFSWNPLSDEVTYSSDEPFKLQFAFDHQQFLTPFLTVTDGSSHYLRIIRFTFTIQHQDIIHFDYELEYSQSPGKGGTVDRGITVSYQWKHQSEITPVLAMQMMIGLWIAAIWTIIILICYRGWREQQKEEGGGGGGGGRDQLTHTKGV